MGTQLTPLKGAHGQSVLGASASGSVRPCLTVIYLSEPAQFIQPTNAPYISPQVQRNRPGRAALAAPPEALATGAFPSYQHTMQRAAMVSISRLRLSPRPVAAGPRRALRVLAAAGRGSSGDPTALPAQQRRDLLAAARAQQQHFEPTSDVQALEAGLLDVAVPAAAAAAGSTRRTALRSVLLSGAAAVALLAAAAYPRPAAAFKGPAGLFDRGAPPPAAAAVDAPPASMENKVRRYACHGRLLCWHTVAGAAGLVRQTYSIAG